MTGSRYCSSLAGSKEKDKKLDTKVNDEKDSDPKYRKNMHSSNPSWRCSWNGERAVRDMARIRKQAAIMRLGVAYSGLHREDLLTLLPAVVNGSVSTGIAALSALALGFVSHGQGHDWDQSFLLGQEHHESTGCCGFTGDDHGVYGC
ncbi:uncharacterized protein F5147DRAFT_657659 [Suillus discolor]|uniref:Uncharacterized protein n=1 Tax=Suillus discolor TaxID=1912936 RepID=A0A9P7EW36_9AGAM|nr:uncharacterized protein F5147DRAFT_657659 [Suillus discolor]KAG2092503.1 hypothetical protein F5147DRAFT_657659 [Suillus discolor]